MKAQQPSIHDQVERFSILVRRSLAFWRRALLVFVVGSILSAVFVFTSPRAYKSETVIQYQETIRSTDIANGESSGENARRTGARLREVLLSRATLEPIIKDLQLYKKSLARGNLIEAVDEMRKNITFRAREGDTFEIAFVGSTPQEAQEVTRRLGECIIQEAATRRAEHAKTLKEFLSAESERNHTDLRQKEAALAAFSAAHPALVARLQQPGGAGAGTAPTSSTPAPTTSGDPVLAALEARAFRIERQLRAASKDQPPPPPRPTATFQPPPDSPELVAARRDLADKLAHYTEKHPDVSAARTRLRAAEAAQAATNQAALDAFNAQQAAARAQDDPPPPKNATDEAALRKELAELQVQIAARRASGASTAGRDAATPQLVTGSDVALEVEFRRLEREVNEARERQRQIDDKLFRASITASSVMNDRNIQVSVLDPAFLPMAPVSKPRSILLAGLLALCLILGLATAAASTVLDDRIYDRMDLDRLDILPVLGTIPRAKLPPKS